MRYNIDAKMQLDLLGTNNRFSMIIKGAALGLVMTLYLPTKSSTPNE